MLHFEIELGKLIIALFTFILLATPGFANDQSGFIFTIASGDIRSLAQLYVVDPQGRRCGFDPTNVSNSLNGSLDVTFGEIPNCQPGRERIDNDVTKELGPESVAVEDNGPVLKGTYTSVFYSTVAYAVPYSWSISIRDSSGDDEIPNISGQKLTLQGQSFLTPGTTAAYTIEYDPTPGSIPVITKAVTVAILAQEVDAAYALGQLGGKRFAAELEALLAKGQRNFVRGDREGGLAVVARLREFVDLIDHVAKEQSRPDRKQDDTRFVTATAAESLTSDAKALIKTVESNEHLHQDVHQGDDGSH